MLTEAQRNNRKILTNMTMIVLFFGFIVKQEVSIPAPILLLIAAAAGITLFMQSMKNPEVVTYVLVAYLPFSRILVGDFGGLGAAVNLTNILMIYIIWAWMSGRNADNEPKWLGSNLNALIIIFMLLGFVSVFRGTASYAGGSLFTVITSYKRWITPFFMFFLVLNTVKKRQHVHNVFTIIMIVGTVVGLMAAHDYMVRGHMRMEKMRIGGICEQPNQLAAFFNYYMFLPFAFFLINVKKSKYWLCLLPFLIQFRGIMVTFSRGGYLAFALGLAAIVWFRSKLLFLVLVALAIFSYFNPILLPGGVKYRMGQTFTANQSSIATMEDAEESLESSAGTRVKIWKAAVNMIADNPFFGVGYGMFQQRIQYYWDGGPKDAHNTYIIVAAEMGFVALFIFLLIIAIMLWNAYHLYHQSTNNYSKAVGLGMLGGIFALMMSNMFGSRLISQEVASYLWIIAALVIRLRINDKMGWDEEDENGEPAAPAPRQTLDACWREP